MNGKHTACRHLQFRKFHKDRNALTLLIHRDSLLSAPRSARKGWVGAIQIPKYIIICFNLFNLRQENALYAWFFLSGDMPVLYFPSSVYTDTTSIILLASVNPCANVPVSSTLRVVSSTLRVVSSTLRVVSSTLRVVSGHPDHWACEVSVSHLSSQTHKQIAAPYNRQPARGAREQHYAISIGLNELTLACGANVCLRIVFHEK
jgi:hypothetical protein